MSREMFAALAEQAGKRQAELDEGIAAWRTGAGAGVRLWCGPGCGNCCTLPVNATLPEALAIARGIGEDSRQRLAVLAQKIIVHARHCGDARSFLSGYQRNVGPCPFLNADNDCAIYAQRPCACRALLSTRPPDWCGVNLAELPDVERAVFLGSLDRTVVAYPTHYAAPPRDLAADFERGLVFTMLRYTGFGVTGNLALLVWLCSLADFDEALAGGIGAFLAFLSAGHVNQPFLVQTEVP